MRVAAIKCKILVIIQKLYQVCSQINSCTNLPLITHSAEEE